MLTEISAEAIEQLGGPEWLRATRRDALARFQAAELPTESEEVWRYSRIDDLDLGRFSVGGEGGPGRAGAIPSGPAEALAERAATVLVDNGMVTSVEVSGPAAAAGLTITPLRELAGEPGTPAHPPSGRAAPGLVAGSADPFVDLSAALMADGVLVEVAPGSVLTSPVVVSHRFSGSGAVVAARTVVRCGPNAQAAVVEEAVSSDELILVLPVVELDLEEGANLDYAGVQALGPQAWQIGYQASRLGRDASLRSLVVALGGWYARVRTDSRLVAAGASTRLLALYFGDGDQMHDFRTLQEHAAPKTTSDLLFKGAVRDTAHGVYSGLIRVRPGAAGTNAFQTNRNLVLSEGATAWSVPNLEIEDNDVRCSHASAVGPVDEEQQYYLESRGVPPEVARQLIVLGFFQDLLRMAPAPQLHAAVRDLVAAKLVAGGGV
ncbi:MAG TPA: Fe-S cluster assembly protein SufD [Acidimicrobiales bacterium]|nr:Fe-S cluster assembly protein SufD [Acidimicrobiales bacterium]